LTCASKEAYWEIKKAGGIIEKKHMLHLGELTVRSIDYISSYGERLTAPILLRFLELTWDKVQNHLPVEKLELSLLMITEMPDR